MKENIKRARDLRKNLTPQEKKLWQIFRNHNFYNFEIRRQYPIGHYIVDFVCRSKKIIIEIEYVFNQYYIKEFIVKRLLKYNIMVVKQ